MADYQYLIVVTVGPVQSYINQARRTHDLFQGSRILSYLAGVGLDEAENYQGDGTIDVIYPMRDGVISDIYASIPNRLLLGFNGSAEQAKDCATVIKNAINKAWLGVSKNTRNYFLGYVDAGEKETVVDIWEDQEKNWLECYWVVWEYDPNISIEYDHNTTTEELKEKIYGENIKRANQAMGSRKLTRDFGKINEIGTKDSITGEHAVLVGKPERTGEKEFWERIRSEQHNRAMISSSERLGAISTTKRFAHEPQAGNSDLEIKYRYPSTSSVATAGFKFDVLNTLTDSENDSDKRDALSKAIKKLIDQLLKCYEEDGKLKQAYKKKVSLSPEINLFFTKDGKYNPELFVSIWNKLGIPFEREKLPPSFPPATNDVNKTHEFQEFYNEIHYKIPDEFKGQKFEGFLLQFLCLDGDYLFDDTLIVKTIAEYLPPLEESRSDIKDLEKQRLRDLKPKVSQAQKLLGLLLVATKDLNIMPPHPYLAILSMDGDKMGKALTKIKSSDKHREFSQNLRGFAANRVEKIVEEEHLGRLVYAGGDDVLALLPIRDALPVAEDLRKQFSELIHIDGKALTASTGIVFIHHTHDLQTAIRSANSTQKDLAKTNAGRNAIAVRLLRRSGEPREMSSKWIITGENSIITMIMEWEKEFRDENLSRSLPYDMSQIAYQMSGSGVLPDARYAELYRVVRRRLSDRDKPTAEHIAKQIQVLAKSEDIFLSKLEKSTSSREIATIIHKFLFQDMIYKDVSTDEKSEAVLEDIRNVIQEILEQTMRQANKYLIEQLSQDSLKYLRDVGKRWTEAQHWVELARFIAQKEGDR